MERNDDNPIVSRVLSGEPAAFATLVARYQRSVMALAVARCQNPAEAEDIAQEAFLTAYTRLAQLRRPAAFGPWLMQITIHRAQDHFRAAARLERTLSAARPVAGSATDEDGLGPREQQLSAAIARLPDAQRTLVLMRYFEGMTVHEIADATGRRHEAVKRQLSRALARLRNAVPRKISHE